MNCKKVNNKLLFYVDDELDNKEKQEIELHLAACQICREKLEELKNTQEFLHRNFNSIRRESAPPWIWMELEQRLAMLNSGGPTCFSRMKNRLQALSGYRPGWKPILAGILAIAMIVSSVIFVPRLMSPPPEVVASDIAVDSPIIRALAGGTPLVEATRVSDTTGYVLSQGAAGESNLAYIDLQQSDVTKLFRIPIPPLTEDDKTQSLAIARANPDIQQILGSGGTMSTSDMFPLSPRLRLEVIDGHPELWSEGTLVGAVLRLKSLTWIARINLGEGKVVNVSMVSSPSPTQTVQPADISNSKQEVTEIAESDPRVRTLLDQGARIDHVALGRDDMADRGAMILKLGDEVWAARVNLNSGSVTRVETVPKARTGKANLFNLE